MTDKNQQYKVGDWIVHQEYGVGQIKKVETKQIGEHENSYFRVESADSTYWIPIDQQESKAIRPVVPEPDFSEAVAIFENPPGNLDSNYSIRNARIRSVLAANEPLESARMIRDLRARRKDKGFLNRYERKALRNLTKLFTHEWAVCEGIQVDRAQRKLNHLLRRRFVQKEH